MVMVQECEWSEAQKIVISLDLVAAAKKQLRFLAEVNKNPNLYDGSVLDRAIARYKYCWLPLLCSRFRLTESPLVVPLDCEWIWHCHRLNPVQYKADCENLYGMILDTSNVVSSVEGSSKKETEEIWKKLYPAEPYDLDLKSPVAEQVEVNNFWAPESTMYDLISAVKRQSSFFYQVDRPNMRDDLFLEGAVERYKGFLHLIKKNKEKSINRFCVPTYDIDLLWHSHQLNPALYIKDMENILGKVLEHDDTDSDRAKGKKLDIGFSQTTNQWEETFGLKYWRVGAMYRGEPMYQIKSSADEVVSFGFGMCHGGGCSGECKAHCTAELKNGGGGGSGLGSCGASCWVGLELETAGGGSGGSECVSRCAAAAGAGDLKNGGGGGSCSGSCGGGGGGAKCGGGGSCKASCGSA